jgi:3-deoxy-manno-octulosonate cytidylyltransferase (CMP-KDO synthetase)
MIITGIIPARYAAQRFPGKPLTIIQGKPMIQWVYENAIQCADLNEVIVATDDERIYNTVLNFGGKCAMTSSDHLSGTDRCAEVAANLPYSDAIINIQGDEPKIHPGQISEVARLLQSGASIATLVRVSDNQDDFQNPNIVKVVRSRNNNALYFSRSSIPHLSGHSFLQHVGVYGFKRSILLEINRLSPSELELQERLEQLRWLENGYAIQTGETNFQSISIDTPDDVKKLTAIFG